MYRCGPCRICSLYMNGQNQSVWNFPLELWIIFHCSFKIWQEYGLISIFNLFLQWSKIFHPALEPDYPTNLPDARLASDLQKGLPLIWQIYKKYRTWKIFHPTLASDNPTNLLDARLASDLQKGSALIWCIYKKYNI